jgi:hypothetical protein
VEFGYGDAGVSHQTLRLEWLEYGAPWSSTSVPKPKNWNAYRQIIDAGFGHDLDRALMWEPQPIIQRPTEGIVKIETGNQSSPFKSKYEYA